MSDNQAIRELSEQRFTTPSLIYDCDRLASLAKVAADVRDSSGAKVLYAVKACIFPDVLQALSGSLTGFAVSSLFEARLVRKLLPNHPLHLTTPGLRDDEIDELADLCDFIAFNSETQLHRFGPRVNQYTSVGIRVNTGISYTQDSRYDPARQLSKLGVPLGSLTECLASSPVEVKGLHFHTNCDSEDLEELEDNVVALVDAGFGGSFDWVNFGGGYLLDSTPTLAPLKRSVKLVKSRLANNVYLEPGSGLVRSAGRLATNVIDLFNRDGVQIAVLDASVNHLPEVLEFDWQPDVAEATDDGEVEYLLVGSSCLAGDVFGRYRFNSPLAIGTTIAFLGVGAYAQVKSDRFNGINLPSVWVQSPDGVLERRQSHTYEDYLGYWVPDVYSY